MKMPETSDGQLQASRGEHADTRGELLDKVSRTSKRVALKCAAESYQGRHV